MESDPDPKHWFLDGILELVCDFKEASWNIFVLLSPKKQPKNLEIIISDHIGRAFWADI